VSQGVAIAPNIPVDPVVKEETPHQVMVKRSLRKLQNVVALGSLVLTFVGFVVAPSPLTVGFMGFQVITYLLFRRLAKAKKPKGWGIVYDKTTNQPLGRSIVRIFSKKFNKLLETQVTDEKGKYGFFTGKDIYYVTAERQGYTSYVSNDVDLTKQQENVVDQSIPLGKN
ncbi:MAG: hypothetical protein Q8R07_05140, partial [Candidatus Uhrbacteria bacterium]|nr:hypothetical protein [Candidatus Uhrbacteria bacterium]